MQLMIYSILLLRDDNRLRGKASIHSDAYFMVMFICFGTLSFCILHNAVHHGKISITRRNYGFNSLAPGYGTTAGFSFS